jgi:hypothetical protein
MNQPTKPSRTGITGWPRDTASDLRTPAENSRRSSYFEAKRHHPGFYAILDALFLTNTILFLGASLTDPDVQLVLENATIAVPSDNKHFAVVPAGNHPSLVRSAERTYNITFLEYPVGNYADLDASLADLAKKVNDYRNAP